MALFDGDPSTCMTLKGVLRLTIVPTEHVHQLMILTRGMDCTKRFHVSVSVRQQVNQCQKVALCQLVSCTYMNGSAELSECVYSVLQNDGDIRIRLAAVHKTSVCSIIPVHHIKDPA